MLGRRLRLRRYRRQLAETELIATDSANVVARLASLWRGIKPKDLVDIAVQTRMSTKLRVCFNNLPLLVTRLKEHNALIAANSDRMLELSVARQGRVLTDVALDFYLADDHQLPVDEEALLRRLQGLLLEHAHLLRQQDGHYYQRLSELFYQDIIVLTTTLINANH